MPSDHAEPEPQPPLPIGPALARFGLSLYRQLAAEADGNVACSPLSIAAVLGMLLDGARGETARQLRTALGGQPSAGLSGLVRSLAGRGDAEPDDAEGDQVRIEVAHRLWAYQGVHWSPDFLTTLESGFGAAAATADFRADAEAARREINAWVGGRTGQRITELLAPGTVDASTLLVLVNALHLKTPWLFPFRPEATGPLPFHRLDGSVGEAMFMHGGSFRYASGPGWSATALECRGGLELVLLLPDPGRLAELEARLGRDWPDLPDFRYAQVELRLPRWTTRSAADLVPALSALGITLAFTGAADFSAMADEPLLASAAVQQTYVAVDERGLEAAAATAVMVAGGAAPLEQVTFTADRPFLYLVRDTPTGAPLIVGRVADPTVHETDA